jgi:diguanylate cyclase (GGDEF)-like protein/PAS domain S-box-containing protein
VIMRLRADGTVRFASPSVARLWGYLPEEIVGRSVFDIIHPRDAPTVRADRHALLQSADAASVIEYRTLGKDGRVVWVEANTRAVQDHQGRISGTITVIRDVTERRAMVTDLARQAATDPLTGLANRRVFDSELLRCLTLGRPSCLALFDLDHFKQINDTHGHAAGDRVLQRFAKVLRDSLRAEDLAARLGGEEFAALMFGITPDDARLVGERILRRFAEASDEEPRATVSAGLTRIAPGTSPEAAMTAADTALYQAKSAGRNRLSVAA